MSDNKKRAYTIRSPRKAKAPVPLERNEQRLFVTWLRANGYRVFAAPKLTIAGRGAATSGSRYGQIAAAKAMGWSDGFPDVLTALKAGPLCVVEVKRVGATIKDVTQEQLAWLETFSRSGAHAHWAPGHIEAISWVKMSERVAVAMQKLGPCDEDAEPCLKCSGPYCSTCLRTLAAQS